MAYFAELRELTFVSPSGKEFKPLWDELKRIGGKKAPIHDIPQADFAEVQDLGCMPEHYPLELYFVGDDFERDADEFYDALREKGRGTLKHPRWGDIEVMALTWSQTEDWVGDLAAARFSVEFIHAPDLTALTVSLLTAASIQAAADDAANKVATGTDRKPANARENALCKNEIQETIDAIKEWVGGIVEGVDSIRQQFESAYRDIARNIDTLVDQPMELAGSLVALARTPARIAINIKDKVERYGQLIDEAVVAVTTLEPLEAFYALLGIFGEAIALTESVTEGTLDSRTEAVAAHDTLTAAMDSVALAAEIVQGKGYDTDPALLAMLADLRARAAAYLLSSAFDLPVERVYVTDAAYFPLALAYKLTGDPDRFPELARVNGWGGDMLLVIPAGTEVRYYE